MSGAGTSGLQARLAVAPAQAQDPQTSSIALLGVSTPIEDLGDEMTGRGPGLLRPPDQTRWRPLGVGSVRVEACPRPRSRGCDANLLDLK